MKLDEETARATAALAFIFLPTIPIYWLVEPETFWQRVMALVLCSVWCGAAGSAVHRSDSKKGGAT